MKLRKLCCFLPACLILHGFLPASAQTIEHNSWLFWSHQQKISERWQFSADVQVRSADKMEYVNTLLIRPGIGYKISDNKTITMGYTYFGTWDKENDNKNYELENRIFEQFQIENEIRRTEITNRFRYEQRFLDQQNNKAFAQRFRYYLQAQIPLLANPLFTKGFYLSVQNELFLNVQGKNQVNDHFFDQNRSYAGPGYRFSENLDLEVGYMFRYQIMKEENLRNNILQVVIKTSF
ncbi:DUF2490 domain-containing protein [Dyadobacter sp. CY356]|uniref:DUF2490 domain-containing protein n=1 Tax=Dyadobacter sp. CY356 TaxID=2906442 RepID=UPI001F38579A|nr:DUF2490 domain-containing protein [Dyadobacter sp. CY356]MCF0056249.1 DUF2490 domain-containing protein [Dyadobacter sp. CY356]